MQSPSTSVVLSRIWHINIGEKYIWNCIIINIESLLLAFLNIVLLHPHHHFCLTAAVTWFTYQDLRFMINSYRIKKTTITTTTANNNNNNARSKILSGSKQAVWRRASGKGQIVYWGAYEGTCEQMIIIIITIIIIIIVQTLWWEHSCCLPLCIDVCGCVQLFLHFETKSLCGKAAFSLRTHNWLIYWVLRISVRTCTCVCVCAYVCVCVCVWGRVWCIMHHYGASWADVTASYW